MKCPCCLGKKECTICNGTGKIGTQKEPVSAPPATLAEFKVNVTKIIDNALKSFFVRGETRQYLQAVSNYLPIMPESEMQKLMDSFPK